MPGPIEFSLFCVTETMKGKHLEHLVEIVSMQFIQDGPAPALTPIPLTPIGGDISGFAPIPLSPLSKCTLLKDPWDDAFRVL